MLNITQNQLLSIWSDLYRCMLGTNRYGGDTAEIYFHRVMEYSPLFAMNHNSSLVQDEISEANRNFYEIFNLFEFQEDVKIYIDGKRIGRWLLRNENTHRFHVQVKRKRKNER